MSLMESYKYGYLVDELTIDLPASSSFTAYAYNSSTDVTKLIENTSSNANFSDANATAYTYNSPEIPELSSKTTYNSSETTQPQEPAPVSGGYTYNSSEIEQTQEPLSASNGGYTYNSSEITQGGYTYNSGEIPQGGYTYNSSEVTQGGYTYNSSEVTSTQESLSTSGGYTYNSSEVTHTQESLSKFVGYTYNSTENTQESLSTSAGYTYNSSEEASPAPVTQQPLSLDPNNESSAGYTYNSSESGEQSNAASGYSYNASVSESTSSPSSSQTEVDNNTKEASTTYTYNSDTQEEQSEPASQNSNPVSTQAKPSGKDPQPNKRDWTGEFYSIQTKIKIDNSATEPNEAMSKLIAIAEEFTEQATRDGTTIIVEKHMPLDRRTIKSANLGGVAGGVKFIHDSIFYKFATDEHNLYGDLERAMKTASHEMKGLTALIDWELKTVGLHRIKFPLMIVIDYRGSRLVATSILPLGSDTLVIGSGDAGKTIFTATRGPGAGRPGAQQLSDLLFSWGKHLNLREHDMLMADMTTAKVPIAFDVEGHIGRDGHLYCCDFARVFPPTAYNRNVRNSFLFQLFRPEFVKKYKKPLCADAYLRALTDRSMNADIVEATNYLKNGLIPDYAAILDKIPCALPGRILCLFMHQFGINCRYLRYLAAASFKPEMKRLILTEVVARTAKNVCRRWLRETQSPESTPYLAKFASMFNLLFGNGEESNKFWKDLQKEIDQRFEAPPPEYFDVLATKIRQRLSEPTPMSPRLAKKSIRGTASDAKSSKTPSTGRARGRGRGRGRTSKNEREATPENIAESPGSRYSPSPSYLASDSDDERPSTINIEDEKYTKYLEEAHKLTIQREDIDMDQLFDRLQFLLNLELKQSAIAKYTASKNGAEFKLTVDDISEDRPRVKQMFLTSFQHAFQLKKQADETEDFEEREALLMQASEAYIECLEQNTMDDFALHNLSRVITDLLPFRSHNPSEEQTLNFVALRMKALAHHLNPNLKHYEKDVYKLSDIFDEETRRYKRAKDTPWCDPDAIKRLVLLRIELEELALQITSDEDLLQESKQILLDNMLELYNELYEETDSQGSLLNALCRKLAVQIIKMLATVLGPPVCNAERAAALIEGIYSYDMRYITKADWETIIRTILYD